jgi:hypothetical protein
MSSKEPGGAAIRARANVLLMDPGNAAHVALQQQLRGWRPVSVHAVVGLDCLDAPRVCVADWRLFGRIDYLKELLQRRRGAVIVLVGLSGEPVRSDDCLLVLRRHAGEVVAVADVVDDSWASQLMVSVTPVASDGLAAAIQAAAKREPQDLGAVQAHLQEAMAYVQRSDDAGAFCSAARALALAPDQPGIVADVARLLGRMGRSGEGEQLCKVFLLQRPDSASVQQALDELHAIGS